MKTKTVTENQTAVMATSQAASRRSKPCRRVRAGVLLTTTTGSSQTKAMRAAPWNASRGSRENSLRVK